MSFATLGAIIDVTAGRSEVAKDIRLVADEGAVGWAALIIVFGLPAASVLLLARRRWLALLPLAIASSLLAAWFLYYATDWWSNPGQGVWLPAVTLLLLGWVVVAVELWRSRREPL